MAEFQATVDAVGIGGLLWGLDQCDAADRELAAKDASLVVPATVAVQPARHWRLCVQSSVIALFRTRDVRSLLMLGNDLGLLEALCAIGFDGKTEVLLPQRVAPDQCRKVAQNVPAGLVVHVLTPGLLPVLDPGTTVVVIGFDAGGGYVMVDGAAARALGGVRGQRFTGDVIAILPLGGVTVHDRSLENWQMVRRDLFTDFCQPDGLKPVIPAV